MNKRLLVALLALCAASLAHADKLDEALRCSTFAKAAGLPAASVSAYNREALRLEKLAHPEATPDELALGFAADAVTSSGSATFQVNQFAKRANPSAESYEDVSKALVTGATQLFKINQCETITK